jgi:hypothetical protein
LEQRRIDHAEDGGVGADPEGEGEHGDNGEAGRFTELSEGELEVVHSQIDGRKTVDRLKGYGENGRSNGFEPLMNANGR